MRGHGRDKTLTVRTQLFLSDPETQFSKSIGWTMGERTARYAMIIDHGIFLFLVIDP